MVKTAIIGASGFVGRHLWQSYRQSFPDCVGTSFTHPGEGLTPFDIRTPNLAALRLEETGHRAVLIASAKPNVGYCEQEPAAAHSVNVKGILELIRQIGRTSMTAIFISSDYVFDGSKGSYDDDAETKPTTEYGRQKVAVEREIPSLTDNFLILRLSKIYGLEKYDNTLLSEIASSLTSGKTISAADDQFFCATLVADLVGAIHAIQEAKLTGVMNVCSPEAWSRYDIAKELGGKLRVNPELVKRIKLHDLLSMKGRPLNTSMVCSRLRKLSGISFKPLRESIEQMAAVWKK